MAHPHFMSYRKITLILLYRLLLTVFWGILLNTNSLLLAHEGKNHGSTPSVNSVHVQGEMKIGSLGEAWAMIQDSSKVISTELAAQNLESIHAAEEKLSVGLKYMQASSSMVTGDKAKRLESALKQALVQSANVNASSDTKDQVKTRIEFKKLLGALKLVEVQYPAETLKATNGMAMMDHGTGDHTHGAATASTTVSISTKKPLKIGEKADVVIKLTKKEGSPLLLTDLKEAHTKKIHLLLIDPSLSDYHHEHPEPTSKPGEYAFTFTPLKPGPYRVWADLVPVATDTQEYAMTDITSTDKSEPITDRKVKMSVVVEGLKYEINFENSELKAGEAVLGKLKITSQNGKTFSQLEPIMGAYAHIVGFSEDYQTIAHIHPMGEEPTKSTDRGMGELEFHLIPSKSGLMRLFAQVQINGTDKYAPFTLNIKP